MRRIANKARLTAVHGRFAFLFRGGAITAAPVLASALSLRAPYSHTSRCLGRIAVAMVRGYY